MPCNRQPWSLQTASLLIPGLLQPIVRPESPWAPPALPQSKIQWSSVPSYQRPATTSPLPLCAKAFPASWLELPIAHPVRMMAPRGFACHKNSKQARPDIGRLKSAWVEMNAESGSPWLECFSESSTCATHKSMSHKKHAFSQLNSKSMTRLPIPGCDYIILKSREMAAGTKVDLGRYSKLFYILCGVLYFKKNALYFVYLLPYLCLILRHL